MNAAPSSFADYQATLRHLDSLGLFRMNPSLTNMSRVLDAMGLRRPSFLVAQVVGTNGKGSTSSMLAAVSGAHGCKTGLFTSPHFISPRERIRIDGRMISEQAWLEHANRIMACQGGVLSYFELITAIAVSWFAAESVTAAVMEAGLGGTWDATTALAADLTVITPVALDHQSVLGESLGQIARDKSGAIRPATPVCSAEQPDEAWREIAASSKKLGSPLFSSRNIALPARIEDGALPMLLRGRYQKDNAKLAVLAWQKLSAIIPGRSASDAVAGPLGFTAHAADDETVVARGLSRAWIPGRMQRAPASHHPEAPCARGWPPLVLDGAHNEHGLKALGLGLAQEGTAPLAVIFACLSDKDPDRMIPHLRALATGPIFVPPIRDNPRTMNPSDLAARIGVNAVAVSSLAEAVQCAASHMAERMPEVFDKNDARHPLLICGSLYLLGEFYELRPDLLEPPA